MDIMIIYIHKNIFYIHTVLFDAVENNSSNTNNIFFPH